MTPDKVTLNENNEEPILLTLQKIKDGSLDPKLINKESRQEFVELLILQGQDVHSIAQLLKKNEKTIRRDIEEIREKNALSPDIESAKKLIGETVIYARINRDQLMRLSRSKDGSIGERAQAEYYASQVWLSNITKLQSLGYLPQKPNEIIGEIFHHADEEKVLEDLLKQAVDIEGVISGEVSKDIDKIKTLIIKAKDSSKKPDSEGGNNHEPGK